MKLKKHKLPQDKYLAKPSIIKKLLKKLLKLNRKARLLYLGYFYSYNFFLYKNIIIISLVVILLIVAAIIGILYAKAAMLGV